MMEAREAELAKYRRTYDRQPNYRMKEQRKDDAIADLAALPATARQGFLDVSCGRGEMLVEAERLGFDGPVMGTETVAMLLARGRVVFALAHDLPFAHGRFDVVTMFDVIEHLLPGDDKAACAEMRRVGRKHLLITANNKPSFNKAGDDLHINKRPYEEWDALFREWFAGAGVTWIKGPHRYVSETWRVDL
jgi:SAM-dependent methyltransferase